MKEDRPFKCQHEGCGKAFKLQQILNAHKSAHITERSFPCEFPGCSHASKTSVDLKKHQKIHSGLFIYFHIFYRIVVIEINLSHKFSHKSNHIHIFLISVQYHMHNVGVKPHKCNHEGCDKAFAESGDLKKHLRTHTGKEDTQ